VSRAHKPSTVAAKDKPTTAATRGRPATKPSDGGGAGSRKRAASKKTVASPQGNDGQPHAVATAPHGDDQTPSDGATNPAESAAATNPPQEDTAGISTGSGQRRRRSTSASGIPSRSQSTRIRSRSTRGRKTPTSEKTSRACASSKKVKGGRKGGKPPKKADGVIKFLRSLLGVIIRTCCCC